jgi:S-adenosyl-L-methionine hydrolase (adenosine-forming)
MGSDGAIFFLSDYGTGDEFVGVVHAVVHRLAPSVSVIDLSHEVAPFDIAAGAAMLARAVPVLGPGVVLAVVDPGVGSERRPIAVRVDGDGPNWLVGPDNGLLAGAWAALGGPTSAVALDPGRLTPAWTRRPDAGPTFDGRDVFAPAAAHLVSGRDPLGFATAIDAESLVVEAPGSRATRPMPTGANEVSALATWVDRYGNVQLDLRPSDLEELGVAADGVVQVFFAHRPEDRAVPARRVRAFADLEAGELGLVVDSSGLLALVLDQGSAAELTGATSGTVVRITAGAGARR